MSWIWPTDAEEDPGPTDGLQIVGSAAETAAIASTTKSTGTTLNSAAERPNCAIGACWRVEREIVRRM